MDEASATQAESSQNLRMLYPIFKNEVYSRREAMLQISRTGSVTLFLFLASVLFLPHSRMMGSVKGLMIAGVLLFTGTLLYQIKIQASRHTAAKRQLIVLEHSLGLFDEGKIGAAFPPAWKASSSDPIIPLLMGALTGLAVLSCLAILVR